MNINVEDLFQEQRQLVEHFFDHLDHNEVQTLIDHILTCQGTVYITGMGKSGIIAKSISQMLVSIGTRAAFLCPVDALHGDIGSIKSQDLILFLSKSGQSDELLQLCTPIKARGCYTVAVVSNSESLLAQRCDQALLVPLLKELCPFDLAPTTSTILQLILGNTIVAYIMRHKGLTKAEYAVNHPAGRIGKRLTLRVQDVMRKLAQVPVCSEQDLLIDCIPNISAKQSGFLLITEHTKLLGIFTDGDLRRALQQHSAESLHLHMGDLMTSHPTTIDAEAFAYDAMVVMERVDQFTRKKAIKELPVIAGGELVGVVTLHDLLTAGL